MTYEYWTYLFIHYHFIIIKVTQYNIINYYYINTNSGRQNITGQVIDTNGYRYFPHILTINPNRLLLYCIYL